uniref:Uncharacterized protein At2g13890 n=1 Tax=Arabidopsis thaliana TaxID=3702 RepID=Q9ZQJ3_ARATH|nr:hypothetical protein [Arabidopsis thaliana]
MVTEEVVVHKQSRQPLLESSGEQKQCKSSNLSKSRGVTCYNCRKKGHLVATCPEKLELTNTSLESKLSSPNSSSEVVSQGLKNSSSCVMHLFLSKDVDSGHTMEHENDKTEGSTKEETHHLVSTTSQACRADYVSKITILNKKGPPYVSQPVLNRELPKEEPHELGGFTQVEAVMVHKQSPRAECNIFSRINHQMLHHHLKLEWRQGELLDSSREEELVTNNALIQKELPDPTPLPLVMMIPSTEHIVNLTQVRNIEKELDLSKEYLESNSCLRIKVKHEHFKNDALIKAEPCLLVYSDFMTMITHLLFAKGVDNIVGVNEEPPNLEFLSSNLFKRTGIGVVLMPKIDYPSNRTRRKSKNAYELELQGELDLRSNPFQVGEDDVIMEITKDLEFDQELVAEEELKAEEQLEPEEHFETENVLIAMKEYVKDVILTSLVLIHDHQMGMCLICTLFPLSSFVPMGFLDKVFNEANDSHSNHPFDDPNHGITFRSWPNRIYMKSNKFYDHHKKKIKKNSHDMILMRN